MAKTVKDEDRPAGRLDEWIRVTGPVGGREVAGLNFAVPGRLVELFSISAGQLAAIEADPGLTVERIQVGRAAA